MCDLTFEQIRKFNPAADHRFRTNIPDEKIPTLRETGAECLNHNFRIFFDVKGLANMATDDLKKIYMEFLQLYSNSVIYSLLPAVIYKMRQTSSNGFNSQTSEP